MGGHQHYEEANHDSIDVGQLADFNIHTQCPMEVRITAQAELTVMETIKEGKTLVTAK